MEKDQSNLVEFKRKTSFGDKLWKKNFIASQTVCEVSKLKTELTTKYLEHFQYSRDFCHVSSFFIRGPQMTSDGKHQNSLKIRQGAY